MTNSIQAQREELQEIIWDVAKDATGCRPRWIDFDNSTIAELEDTLKLYTRMANEQMDAEAAMEAEAVADYEDTIQQTIEIGAGDRATAVRWFVEVQQEELGVIQGVSDILYHNGLPFFAPKLPAHISAELEAALENLVQVLTV
jgi:hypothetical protein